MGQAELLKALQELEKREKENKLDKFKPYDAQLSFLNSTASITCMLGGNRCLAGDTEIYDPILGSKRRLDQIDGKFHVYAWDGEKVVIAEAGRPYRKHEAPIYRTLLSTGEWFDSSKEHLVLSEGGWRPLSSGPRGFSACHPQTNLEHAPSTHASDVQRCRKTILGSQCSCLGDHHSCDERPLSGPRDAQGILPSLADALGHSHTRHASLDPVSGPYKPSDHPHQPTQADSHACHTEPHLSTLDDLDLIAVPFFDSSRQTEYTLWIPTSDLVQEYQQSQHGFSPQQPRDGVAPQATQCSYLSVAASSCYLPITSILQTYYLRNDYVWDFEVDGYANYVHAGVIHHNSGKTTVGSFAIACHLTGNYPSWWKGVMFAGPVDVWVVGVTSHRVRDTVQEKLFGRIGRIGTGMIPKRCIVEESMLKKTGTPAAIDRIDIKHESGGLSSIQFFSYDQGMEKFMGSSVNNVWFDEEPPENIFNECKMRVLDCSGNIMFTFTPLQGITPLYDNIMQDETIHKVWLTMDDAKHLKKEDIDRLLDGMSDAEKKARREGVATIGAGKVFQFEEHEYTIEPFEIPSWWRRLGGFDVGLGHPTGAVAAAIDDDSKVIYIYKEYKVSEKTAVDIASHLKHWGVKFMSDPSVFSREIATAIEKARAYTDEGMELIKGNRDREEGIHIIRKLIGSGRLYIFDNCHELLKELRTYRTKTSPDGNTSIVKVNDDVIDAMRYLVMGMEEYAEVPNRYKKKVIVKSFKAADSKVGY